MTERVYEKDAYQQALDAVVVRAQEGAVVLDRTIFYARAASLATAACSTGTAAAQLLSIP